MYRSLILWLCIVTANATVANAQSQAQYQLELTYTWSASTHPYEFPTGGHMSKLFGVTHGQKYILFKDGHTPSSGLKLVAENGRNTILSAELEEALRRKRIATIFEGPSAPTAPGRVQIEFEATSEHPYLSFVSMIAPSPDWFTGISAFPLLQNDDWINEAIVPLWAWDAGSDNGTTYLAKNSDTQPRQSVRILATEHFLGREGLRAVGQAVITRIK